MLRQPMARMPFSSVFTMMRFELTCWANALPHAPVTLRGYQIGELCILQKNAFPKHRGKKLAPTSS